MRLQKLEINGFKSFADKVDFEFEPGVTAFVGPNGCGKSNVVDAVRWILGEQSPKAIRGGTMQDIIFNGGGARKPKGYAEASLTILNDRGILPVDYTEVCVTRRLFRTGESEYLINKQPCRLRDIREMFMDTGVGMQTYSIIEQGRVARLLQANPVERRAVFEEAAGISKYKVQRRAAQAKLDRTLENLERAQMLASEKEARLRSIKNQAAKARRWQEYQERLREIQYSLSLHTWRKAEALRRKALDEIAASEGMAAELAHQLASAEAALAAIEQEAAETERLHDETQRSLHQVETQRQAAQQNIRRNTDLISEYDAAAEEAAASLQTLESRLARAREELTRARAELEELHQLVQAQTQAAREQTRSAQESANECLRIEQSLDRWKSEIIESAHRAVQLRNEINNLVNSQQQDTARRARLDERRAATDKALQELNEAAARLTEQRLALDARLESGRVA
ncbi:MAG TPA: AAA family ATPase, partial [Candidatus Brocadiia bacterium]|nr:AAA family ATPase [Candidatus Brocadiia bacterium]